MKKINIVLIKNFIANTFLVVIKITVGILGNSKVLVADGVHSISDLLTDVVAIFGNIISSKPKDERHPYGYGKMKYVTSISMAVIILFLGVILILAKPSTDPPSSNAVIFLAIFTIILKSIFTKYVMKKGKEYHDSILITTAKENRIGVISSIIVLVASFLSIFFHHVSILKYSDYIGSLLIGLIIIKTAIEIIIDNFSSLLTEAILDLDEIEKIKNEVLEYNEVADVVKVILLKYGYYYKAIIDINVNGDILLKDARTIAHKIENKIMKNNSNKVLYVNVHVNSK